MPRSGTGKVKRPKVRIFAGKQGAFNGLLPHEIEAFYQGVDAIRRRKTLQISAGRKNDQTTLLITGISPETGCSSSPRMRRFSA